MLEFQPWTIFFTIVNLLILYFFFRKFLFGRVNAVLEQREALIRSQIQEAEAANAQAHSLQQEYQAKLDGARQEADDLLEEARQRAEAAARDRMAQAEAAARRTVAETEARLAAERGEMMRQARGELAQLAVMAASEVAGKRLDTDSDRALAEEFWKMAGEQA